LNDFDTCSNALRWISMKYRKEEFPYLKQTYEKMLRNDDLKDLEAVTQIEKDLHRTNPDWKFLSPEIGGAKILGRILATFSKYDPTLGYVQGMNFIAAALLYHAEEYLAFWLMALIFETFEMRDIYLPGLPGLSKHCQIIDILISNYLPSIYTHFCKYDIKVQLFCTEWILALFGSVIPIDKMTDFYEHMLKDGWPFFYKLIMAFLSNFKNALLRETDFTGIFTILKSQNHITKKNMSNPNTIIVDWGALFQAALKNKELDSHFVYKMHSNYDVDSQQFRINLLDTETY